MSRDCVAMFGGTFDPLHLGHLRVAWEAAEALGAEVRMMPASVPPHRAQPVATAAQRSAIMQAALAGQSRLLLDTRELDRDGPSYSVDTLASLRRELGPEPALVMLVGADALAGLPSWHRWQQLLEQAHIGVLTRPGHPGTLPEAVARAFPDCLCDQAAALRMAPHGKVLPIEVTALDISASRVRELLAAGREPRFLLPEAVLDRPELLQPYRRAPA